MNLKKLIRRRWKGNTYMLPADRLGEWSRLTSKIKIKEGKRLTKWDDDDIRIDINEFKRKFRKYKDET